MITIRHAGLATVTDLGRLGLARHGIPAGGAADQYSATVANLLVGNAEGEPLIEITGSALVFAADRPLLAAVTGAAAVVVGRRRQRLWEPVCVAANEPVAIGPAQGGLRAYVAVHGWWDVPRLLGSCAPNAQLGVGIWLRPGTRVAVDSGYHPIDHPVTRHPVFAFGARPPRFSDPRTIDVTYGPDAAPGTATALDSATYTVGPDSDQVGLRLSGPVPPHPGYPELLSKGVPAGAVELTPDGELVVLLRGRPVTAGYPVLAVATQEALSALGQVGPGHLIRFQHRSLDEAVLGARRQRAALNELGRRVRTAFASVGIPHHIDLMEPLIGTR